MPQVLDLVSWFPYGKDNEDMKKLIRDAGILYLSLEEELKTDYALTTFQAAGQWVLSEKLLKT